MSVVPHPVGNNPGWSAGQTAYNESSNWSHLNLTMPADHFNPELNFLQLKVRLTFVLK